MIGAADVKVGEGIGTAVGVGTGVGIDVSVGTGVGVEVPQMFASNSMVIDWMTVWFAMSNTNFSPGGTNASA